MTEANLADLLTQWTKVLRAGQPVGDTAVAARNELLVRYHEAVRRYLRSELHDEQAAEQVFSNFAVRVLEADRFLQRADPGRGRFRDYLKVILQHMAADYYRERQREQRKQEALAASETQEPPASDPATGEEDERFLDCWRQELVNQTWQALEQAEKRTGQPYAALLGLQNQQPGLRSAQVAEQLAARLGRPFTAANVRQLTHRARELFSDLLVGEVARSLQADLAEPQGVDRVEEELMDLGLLLTYCKTALARCRDRYREGFPAPGQRGQAGR
jgi:RNA polymerase sigma-70 factor (ECF subfamily)